MRKMGKPYWIVGFFFTFLWLPSLLYFAYNSLHVPLPKEEGEFSLFFKESRDDLKYIVAKALKGAKTSIVMSSFGFTDPDVIQIVKSKTDAGIPVQIRIDPKTHNDLPPSLFATSYQGRGLMHRKLIDIDKSLVFLGSLNMTAPAFRDHRNIVLCVKSKALSNAIDQNILLKEGSLVYFPLPEAKKEALTKLLSEIEGARERVWIAMYTLTHKKILAALNEAKKRGVDVKIFIDRGMASGVSKKAISFLKENGIPTSHHLGNGLFHHKCALIDDTFILGSVNWTKAGFTINQEYLLALDHLSPYHLKQIETFFSEIKRASHSLN